MKEILGIENELAQLFEEAHKAAECSYSPYSHFRVGAALQLSNGVVVTGTNVENVSFGLTICAERAALFQAVSRFGPKIRVTAVAITNLNQAASPPCGACRQVLAEFASSDVPVLFPASEGRRRLTMGELLPAGYEMKLL